MAYSDCSFSSVSFPARSGPRVLHCDPCQCDPSQCAGKGDGGCENEGRGAKGDKGKALGPYQIWNIYWQDAAVPGREYREVLHDKKLSELVVERYMQRYARESLRRLQRGTGTLKDVEVVARIHNGGPKGHRRKSTLGYWNKARAVLSLSSVTK